MKIKGRGLYLTSNKKIVEVIEIHASGIWPVKGVDHSWTITGCTAADAETAYANPALHPGPMNIIKKISYDENPELFL